MWFDDTFWHVPQKIKYEDHNQPQWMQPKITSLTSTFFMQPKFNKRKVEEQR